MIDLHTHSTASDGTLSPADLVLQASKAGVKALALTDHDCVAGIAEAQLAADKNNIKLIPGIELSVMWSGRTLHLLGLNIDTSNSDLTIALQKVLDFRRWRAEEIPQKLEEIGVEVPVVVRLEGNNAELGRKVLAESGLNIIAATSLTDAAQQAVKAAGGAA